MIIVTGSCRSGTSMMMQTLKLLGVEVAGEKFHPDFPVIEGNPKGYYDIPFEKVGQGLGEEYNGMAVKLLGEWLPLTNPVNATHIIVCRRRDTQAQDRSTIKLLKLEEQTESDSEIRKNLLEQCLSFLSPEEIRKRRWFNYKIIDEYVLGFTGYVKDVYFEDMYFQPTQTIQEIRDFLFLDSDTDIKKAVSNIGIE